MPEKSLVDNAMQAVVITFVVSIVQGVGIFFIKTIVQNVLAQLNDLKISVNNVINKNHELEKEMYKNYADKKETNEKIKELENQINENKYQFKGMQKSLEQLNGKPINNFRN